MVDRRREPRADVLTGLATATFPDGSLPEVIDVVRVAANLFTAGQETTVRLLAASFKLLAEEPDLQGQLRDDAGLIPDFVEEVLRTEGPVKGDFRLARRAATVGGVEIPAGSTIMVLNGAASRDPRRFDAPDEFRLPRANGKEHLAFGRGQHACPGGPLRAPRRASASSACWPAWATSASPKSAHGPAGDRHYEYAPTYILRGVAEPPSRVHTTRLEEQAPDPPAAGHGRPAGAPSPPFGDTSPVG